MSTEIEKPTIGLLLSRVLKQAKLSPKQFGDKYGFSKPRVHRWLHDKSSVNVDLPYPLVSAMAEVAHTTTAEIFFQLGYNVFSHSSHYTMNELAQLRLYPLVLNVRENVALHEAVRVAKSVRAGYWGDGKMKDVLSGYLRAADYAYAAGEKNLNTYLMIYVCNIEWMTGNLIGAESIFEKTHDQALRIQHDAKKSLDYDLEWLGARLAAHSKIRWLWAKWWAGGVSEESISQGHNMIEELKACNFYQRIPYVFEYLTRCAISLGRFSDAVAYAEMAQAAVQKLNHEWYARYELFLDAGATGQGGMNYVRQEDHFRETLFDALIAAGNAEKAYETYTQIHYHREPQAYLSLHHWFHPTWQNFLAQEIAFEKCDDPKIGIAYYDWDLALDASSNFRVQALTAFNQGLYQLDRGNLLDARFCFQRMQDLATACSANDLVAQAIAFATLVAIQENKKSLAITKANVLEEKRHYITNPYIREQCEAALTELSKL